MKTKLIRTAFLVASLCALAACRKSPPSTPAQSAAEPLRLASIISAGDQKVAAQFASGFYTVEAGSWRWTGQQFSIILGAPPRSAQQGAKLSLAITVPPPVIEKLGSTTLSASAGEAALAPETYSKAGSYTYEREIAPAQLSGDTVRINFRLDRAMPPAGADIRELGIIVIRASLVSK